MAIIKCSECKNDISDKAQTCPQCGAPQGVMNTAARTIPDGVRGWSWGAFFLGWIWAIGNSTWIGLLTLIPGLGLIMNIFLGLKGREWAWKNEQWDSIEHFNRVQKKWSYWGVMFFIVIAIILFIVGAFTTYSALKVDQAAKITADALYKEEHATHPPKFVDIGTFTNELVPEKGDHYLQVGISLKITKPELEEKIKASSPEILYRVNMLLKSKRPSDLATNEGKDKLAQQIKGQVEYVLGLRSTAPSFSSEPTETQPTETPDIKSDIAEVLFTSFIIQ